MLINASRRWIIGLRKVVTLVEQRLSGQRGECIGEAIAEIEAGGMAPLAVTAPCATGLIGMLGFDCDELDTALCSHRSSSLPPGSPRRVSITIAASSTVAAAMRRTGSSAMRCSMEGASGSLSAIATIAEVWMTLSSAARTRRSR